MKHFFLLFITILLFAACAQQNKSLTGGPKDTIPPQIVNSNPNYNDTSFTEEKIIIKFDEYFKLNNINAEFFSSPPFKEMPDFKVKGKKIIIKLNEKLKDSITYFLNFGNSIVDFHENNELEKFNLFFSTYNQIDTLKISGEIIDAYTQQPISGVYVMLYDKNNDSIPFNETPTYLAKTDSSGVFVINNIKAKKYKIFALEDLNNNFIFNEDESKIAFSDSLIKPWVESFIQYDTLDSGTVFKDPKFPELSDTLKHDTIISKIVNKYYPNNVKLKFFTKENAKQEIIRSKRSFKNSVKLSFIKPLHNNYIKIEKFHKNDSIDFTFKKEEYPSHDSMHIWFTDIEFFSKDTLSFLVNYKTSDSTYNTDTLELTNYNYSTDTLPIVIKTSKKNINSYNSFPFTSEALIKSFDSSKISLFQIVDTLVDDAKIQKIKTIRPELDSLIFIFDRPIINKFDIIFDNYSQNDESYYWSKNNLGDSVFCKINDRNIALKDTLKFKVLFDNQYFFNQIQLLSEKIKIPV
ncbi:MAG: Ig-like domain-containing domain, partial [Bacteroidota bacterium]|nr:Ig-like domain-containing domain [Bacteroidota bacterium]